MRARCCANHLQLNGCRGEGSNPIAPGPVPVASVAIARLAVNLVIGATQQMTASALDSAGSLLSGRAVTWTTSDSAKAKVSASGLVMAVSSGVATVTATVEGKTATVTVAVSSPDVSVGIVTPTANAFVGDTLTVQATVTSVYRLSSVTVVIGGHVVPMSKSDTGSRWIGTLNIADAPFTSIPLLVTATDIRSSTGSRSVTVRHDPPPSLTITSPTIYDVASPTMVVKVTCTDRNASACADVRVSTSGFSTNVVLATGVSGINTTVSLAAYEGLYLALTLSATDSSGQTVSQTGRVQVFTNNAHLQGTATVPGLAIDVNGSRVLYADTSAGRDVLRIHDVGVPDVMVFSEANARVPRNEAILTASGAIFEKLAGGSSTGGMLHEYRNGSLLTLGTGYVGS
ncbi:MAG TPA: Ig-like domain-containing protein, partial [Acidimicrobiales bacterium]